MLVLTWQLLTHSSFSTSYNTVVYLTSSVEAHLVLVMVVGTNQWIFTRQILSRLIWTIYSKYYIHHWRPAVTRWLWVRSPLGQMNYYLLISLYLCCGSKVKSPLLNFATQHIIKSKNLAEIGERSALTLGPICLPCYMRDIAWSWLLYSRVLKVIKIQCCSLITIQN